MWPVEPVVITTRMGGHYFPSACVVALVAALFACPVAARPIFSAGSTTAMAEYREGTMRDASIFYAPEHNWSVGLSHTELKGDANRHEFEGSYARINLLVKRWNFESAQANVYGWGGLGTAHLKIPLTPEGNDDHDHDGPPPTAWREYSIDSTNWGGQIDFETRRIYASFRTDLLDTPKYWHRVDTLELGFAPYKHEADSLATWILLSASNYAGNLHEDTELALMLRFFKKRVWVEAGATTDGLARANLMVSF